MRLQSKLEELEEEVQTERESSDQLMVTDEDIRDVVSMWTGIPLSRIASEEMARLLEMEQFLRDRVIGQDEAIGAVAKAVRRARAGLKNPKRPIGVFMFLGPTGVGKTYLAETLSEFMFGSKDNIVRLDMSEFMEKHTVSRLVGSPPGYVGYDDGGQLTDLVRRRSYCLILLDEIEKAHPDVFNMLLQIFDDGHLSDAKGRKVDFRNTIIIMTSNVGSDLIRKDSRFGFTTRGDDVKTAEQQYTRMKDQVTEEMKRVFRPEFLNRIDQSVVFHALAQDHIREIVDLELRDVRENLREKDMSLEVSQALLDYLGEKGFDPVFGARPLRRVIQNEVEDRLSDALLEGDFEEGSHHPPRLRRRRGHGGADRQRPPAGAPGRGGRGARARPHALSASPEFADTRAARWAALASSLRPLSPREGGGEGPRIRPPPCSSTRADPARNTPRPAPSPRGRGRW